MHTFQTFQILPQHVPELAIIGPRDLEVKSMLSLIEHFGKSAACLRTELNLSWDELTLQASQSLEFLQQHLLELAVVSPGNFVSQCTRTAIESVRQELLLVRATLDLHNINPPPFPDRRA